ncbi:MAG: hypothetical protein IJP49_10180 [Bacteroidales bacterium]|nr:hypothetical protein [Bacteroidales bacterium]
MFRPILICLLALLSCTKDPVVTIPDPPQEKPDDTGGNNGNNDTSMPTEIKITISGKSLPVKIEDNAATKALVAALRESSITYEADDYGGFEKVGALGRSLPTSNTQISTQPGDVILYSGNQIVLFYGSNSWSYTRIGKMEYGTLDELKSFLKAGQGKVSVSLSL